MDKRRLLAAWRDYRVFLLYFFALYVSNAVFGPFLARYLDSIGFSKSSIGLVIGWAPVFALVAQPIWGVIGDRVRVKNRLLAALLVTNAVCIALIPLRSSFAYVALFLILTRVLQGPISTISGTIALEDLTARDRDFGPVRMAGTLGYMAYFLVLGPVLVRWGFGRAFGISSGVLLCAAFLSFGLPRVEGHWKKRQRVNYRALFGDRELVLLVVFTCLLMVMMYHYYNHFAIYLRELTGSDRLGALAVAVSTVGEIPFLLLGRKIVKRFGVRRMIVFAGIMLIIRFAIWGFVTHPGVLVASQLLHATNFIVLDYCLAVYINHKMPPELKSTGQSFKQVVGFTLPLAVGAPIVGWLSDVFGIQMVFRIGVVWFAVITAVFAVVLLPRGGDPADMREQG